jgi:hypothetical protein
VNSLDKILPSVASTERIKRINRRQQNNQQNSFRETLKEKQKKKREKKNRTKKRISIRTDAAYRTKHTIQTGRQQGNKDESPVEGLPAKKIDIRA